MIHLKKRKHSVLQIGMLVLVMIVGLTSCAKNLKVESEAVVESNREMITESKANLNPEIYIISDIHHLSKTLYEDNETFQKFVNSGDGKLINYSSEIMEAFIAQIKSGPPEVLIVSGDLTTNGELQSHRELANWFADIESLGTKVLVIPGNHDINNPYALSFLNNERVFIDSISPQGFYENYNAFGYDDAISKDSNSLSYLSKISEDLYALMLDTCVYENNLYLGFPVTRGVLTEETLAWIDSLKEQIPQGAKIFSVSHHNMAIHAEILTEGYTLDNSYETVEHLSALGIKVNFSGHIHTQDVKSRVNPELTDVVTGSLIQYPQTFGLLSLEGEGASYVTKWVDVERYAKEKDIQDAFLLDFKANASQYFYDKSSQMVQDELVNYSDLEKSKMADVVGRLNMVYFAGEEPNIRSSILESDGYALWQNHASESFVKQYIETMLEDETYGNVFSWTWN